MDLRHLDLFGVATANRMGIISIKMLIMNILLRRGFESLDIKV